MSGNSKKVIAFNYFGGKFTFVDEIVRYFPIHKHFVDVFCGSMSITLNKRPSLIDTANDLNGDVVNFFKCLRDEPEELIRKLRFTPVSREEYTYTFYCLDEDLDPIEKARHFFVRARQSYYGLGAQHKHKGWHAVKTSSRSNKAENVSKWINSIENLWLLVDTLRRIQIEQQDFRELIPKMDFKESFFYCDPPYPIESRSSHQKGDDYKHDFTNEDHEDLAEVLNNIKGKAMISSYDCDMMQRLYPEGKWYMHKLPPKKNNIKKTRVVECLWTNYETHRDGQLILL